MANPTATLIIGPKAVARADHKEHVRMYVLIRTCSGPDGFLSFGKLECPSIFLNDESVCVCLIIATV